MDNKLNKSDLFKAAHKAAKLNDTAASYRVKFAQGLKLAYEVAKTPVVVVKEAQIVALEDALQEAGLDANIWNGGNHNRIYINGLGKDIKAYYELDEPQSTDYESLISGSKLKVFSNANQNQAWLTNRAKQVKFSLMQDLFNAGITPEICEDWKQVIL